MAQLVYSPDAAPSNFFLLGRLKGEMAEFTTSSLKTNDFEFRRVFEEIPKDTTSGLPGSNEQLGTCESTIAQIRKSLLPC
jgi:hypothetical protein